MGEESLNLEVRDFGPIGQANLELRPLTVFVGPSNTGKSYLAMLIYALHKHFSRFDSNSWWHAEEEIRQMLNGKGERLALDLRKTRDGWSREDKKIQTGGKSVDVLQTRTWELSESFKELLQGTFGAQGAMLRMEIERCFGSSIRQLTRNAKRSKFQFQLKTSRQPTLNADGNRGCVECKYSNSTLGISIPDGFELKVKGGRRRFADLELEFGRYCAQMKREAELAEMFEFPVLREILREIVLPRLFGRFGWPAHYLPAGRAAFFDTFDTVVGSFIDQASTLSGIPPTVAGVYTDYLRQLMNLAKLKPEQRNSPLSEIEAAILQGSISIETPDEIKFPQFSYKPVNRAGWELPLKNASSMVSEVGPISLYEKHIVKEGELLIVDEPESHLHPALQVELFRQLAKLVNQGKRVIVTTHSEWVSEELANIVQRSKLEPPLTRVAEPKPGVGDMSLPEADVGVWQFKKRERSSGSTVEEIPIGDTGLYDTGFDAVAISSHNEWARISNALGDDE